MRQRAAHAQPNRLMVRHADAALGRDGKMIAALKAAGWTPVIVSAGYTQAIVPLAKLLGIARIEAVRLDFDAAGNYAGFDAAHPATRKGGKPENRPRKAGHGGAGRHEWRARTGGPPSRGPACAM